MRSLIPVVMVPRERIANPFLSIFHQNLREANENMTLLESILHFSNSFGGEEPSAAVNSEVSGYQHSPAILTQ